MPNKNPSASAECSFADKLGQSSHRIHPARRSNGPRWEGDKGKSSALCVCSGLKNDSVTAVSAYTNRYCDAAGDLISWIHTWHWEDMQIMCPPPPSIMHVFVTLWLHVLCVYLAYIFKCTQRRICHANGSLAWAPDKGAPFTSGVMVRSVSGYVVQMKKKGWDGIFCPDADGSLW